mgnify:CR=1 FL=1
MTALPLCFLFAAVLLGGSYAVPGPDTTAVLANVNVNSSVALAYYYAQQRGIPKKQVTTHITIFVVDIWNLFRFAC